MKDFELQKVLNAIKYIPEESERDEVTQIILKAASESITLERLKALASGEGKKTDREHGANGFIKFTKKEIDSMPDYLKKLFTVNERIVTYALSTVCTKQDFAETVIISKSLPRASIQ